MKKTHIGLFMSIAFAPFAIAGGHGSMPQASDSYFQAGKAALEDRLNKPLIEKRAKNVILMVADGNGVGTNYATRVFMGQKRGGYGDEFVLPYETAMLPNLALVKTYNHNAQTPDSAGTSTSMNTGVKTKAGVIGVRKEHNRGDCTADEYAIPGISDLAKDMGKSVGVVSTARITHATPATVYAHSGDRNWEDNSSIPEGCDQKDIALQLIESHVDVAMGGGRRHFIPTDVTDPEGKTGKRTDGRNLVDEFIASGGQYAYDTDTFSNIDVSAGGRILGLFESSHMQYEHDRTNEPSLADMSIAAIQALSRNEQGYYLSIEAGRVDHANHAGNLHRVVTDGEAFANAVSAVLNAVDLNETLVIVTSDHEHAIAFNGYCGRGSPITGLCYGVNPNGVQHTDEAQTGSDGKAYTVVNYLQGPGSVLIEQPDGTYVGGRPDVTNEEAMDPDYLQQALIPKSSETHSGEDVAVYAGGPYAHLFDGVIEQNMIFHVMHYAMTAK